MGGTAVLPLEGPSHEWGCAAVGGVICSAAVGVTVHCAAND